MVRHVTEAETFTGFVQEVEGRLSRALAVRFGPEVGMEAAADALFYAWKNWEKIRVMNNPIGYLYKVGTSKARPKRASARWFPEVNHAVWPWVEPKLPGALMRLSDKQRTVVFLIHGYEWTHGEVAEVLEITKGSVQTHEQRALKKLRAALLGGTHA